MQLKRTSRSTFKPQLEALETRDLPSAAGIALYMDAQSIQQGVQAMQAQANTASSDFKQLGSDEKASLGSVNSAVLTDVTKIGGDIQSIRLLNNQVQAQLQNFQQAVFGVGSDGDQGDHFIAIVSYFQVNGLNLSGGPNPAGSLASQAQNALNQANGVATSNQVPLPGGGTFSLNLTFDGRLNGQS